VKLRPADCATFDVDVVDVEVGKDHGHVRLDCKLASGDTLSCDARWDKCTGFWGDGATNM
jgi:hypothetical protein